jgi:hypothetical protein
VTGQQAQEPSGIDTDHDDEQVQSEQQVYGFQHLDHLPRAAPVEIVDVEDDPVHRPAGQAVGFGILTPVGHKFH